MFSFLLGEDLWQIIIIIILGDHFGKMDWTIKHEISILKIPISMNYGMKRKRKEEVFMKNWAF
jgi:hypothetical protein